MLLFSSHHLCQAGTRTQLCCLPPSTVHFPNMLQLGQPGPWPSSQGVVLGPGTAAAEEQECFAFVSGGSLAWEGDGWETSPPASGFHLWPFGEHEGCWSSHSLLTPSSPRMSCPAWEGRAVESHCFLTRHLPAFSISILIICAGISLGPAF